jgi:FdhE protein
MTCLGTMPEVKELEARLDRLLKIRPDLAEAAALQRDLLRECYRSAPRPVAPSLPRERARRKLADGTPLLHGEAIDPDLAFCQDLFGRLLNTLQERPESAEAAGDIACAAATGRLELEPALCEALVGNAEHLFELAARAALPADMLATVLELTVRPVLQALATELKPPLRETEAWIRGYCPVCGAWPGLAELQMAEQQRHPRCLRCGADWAALRLLCAYCGNEDHRSLGYLRGEREPRFRVEVCERCKGYLKAVNVFEPNAPEYLVLEDLASVHLDVAALERGYIRNEGSGFRLDFARGEAEAAPDELRESG